MSSPPRGLGHQAVNAHLPTVNRQQWTWFSGRRGSTRDAGSWTAILTGRVPQPVESSLSLSPGTPVGAGSFRPRFAGTRSIVNQKGRGFAVWRRKVLYRLLGLWARYPRGTAAILL